MGGGKRNRQAGHSYERKCASKFRDIGYDDCITTRQGSREKDAAGIDLMNSDESNPLEWSVQCKNTVSNINYHKIMSSLPHIEGVRKLILHKKTEKLTNGKYRIAGEYAIMLAEDWFSLIKEFNQKK